jgi:hypothetical protein
MPSQLFIKSDSVFKINTLGVFLDVRGGLDDRSALQFEIVIAHCIALHFANANSQWVV